MRLRERQSRREGRPSRPLSNGAMALRSSAALARAAANSAYRPGPSWWPTQGICLAASETVDHTTVALGGAAFPAGVHLRHGFALLGCFGAGGAAGIGFREQGLGDGGGAAEFAELEDGYGEFADFVFDDEGITDADFAGGFGGVAIGGDAVQITGLGG